MKKKHELESTLVNLKEFRTENKGLESKMKNDVEKLNNQQGNGVLPCVVKMWNKYNDTWVTGIGIYDIPTQKWEIQHEQYEVHFWFETPELNEQ